jgi:hypothetical protein
MPETKRTELKRTGRRGKYTEGQINFTKTDDNKYWEVKKTTKPADLAKVDSERNAISQKLNATRKELREQAETQGLDEKEATRSINYAIYDTYKGKNKPARVTLDRTKLEEAKRLYAQRQPLDRKSQELRRGEDNSFRKVYDYTRLAKKQGRKGIFLYGENELPLKNIQQITSSGKVITADKTPLPKDGEVVAYRLPAEKIISVGNTTSVSVSNVRRPKLAVTKTTTKKRKVGNKIIFKRVDGNFVTKKKIDLLFKKAEEARGANAPIYLNNIPFEPSAFYKVKGGWALTPLAVAELNAPEYEGTISVRYSQIYRKELISLETRTELGKATKAEKANYGTITANITLPGSTLEGITIICRSKDAYDAIVRMVGANKEAGNGKFGVITRDFVVTKQGNKAVIEITSLEREGNNVILTSDLVTDGQGGLVGKYGTYDRYIFISWLDGYFLIQGKFLGETYEGLKSDKGEEEEEFDHSP